MTKSIMICIKYHRGDLVLVRHPDLIFAKNKLDLKSVGPREVAGEVKILVTVRNLINGQFLTIGGS